MKGAYLIKRRFFLFEVANSRNFYEKIKKISKKLKKFSKNPLKTLYFFSVMKYNVYTLTR